MSEWEKIELTLEIEWLFAEWAIENDARLSVILANHSSGEFYRRS